MFKPKDFDFMTGAQLDSWVRKQDEYDSIVEELYSNKSMDWTLQSKIDTELYEDLKNYWAKLYREYYNNKKVSQKEVFYHELFLTQKLK